MVFTITTPSDDDIGKLLDARKDNTLRWLCCYKTVDDMKVPYLQGGLIFKQHAHDQIWLKCHPCNHATLILMKSNNSTMQKRFQSG
jgi:hypothetical protein